MLPILGISVDDGLPGSGCCRPEPVAWTADTLEFSVLAFAITAIDFVIQSTLLIGHREPRILAFVTTAGHRIQVGLAQSAARAGSIPL